jgi:cation diffusion facilitator family transporter
MSTGGSTKAILAALFANLGLAIAKFIAFLITRSSSMLAESIHSAADTTNQALLLMGGKRAVRQASKTHQFGYGRERYFWSFVVALVLFSLGGLFAIFEGFQKIREPHEVESITVAVVVLITGIFLEGFSLRTAIVESRHVKGEDQSWWEFIREARMPELPVVLLEDAGAMAGLVIALGAITTASLTDNPVYDGWGTLIIGVLLFAIAAVLAREMKSLLIGEGLTEARQKSVVEIIEQHPEVTLLAQLRTQHMGPDTVLVAANLTFNPALNQVDVAAAIDDIEAKLAAALPYALMIYLEPDLHGASAE